MTALPVEKRRRQLGHGGAAERGDAQADAHAGDEHRGEEPCPRSSGRRPARREQDAARPEDHAARHGHDALSVAIGQPAADRREHRGRERPGREREAGAQGRVAPDLREEQDVDESNA